jgi:hypothetical protein
VKGDVTCDIFHSCANREKVCARNRSPCGTTPISLPWYWFSQSSIEAIFVKLDTHAHSHTRSATACVDEQPDHAVPLLVRTASLPYCCCWGGVPAKSIFILRCYVGSCIGATMMDAPAFCAPNYWMCFLASSRRDLVERYTAGAASMLFLPLVQSLFSPGKRQQRATRERETTFNWLLCCFVLGSRS